MELTIIKNKYKNVLSLFFNSDNNKWDFSNILTTELGNVPGFHFRNLLTLARLHLNRLVFKEPVAGIRAFSE